MKYAKVYADDVQVGGEMPPLVKPPIQQIQPHRYAGPSRLQPHPQTRPSPGAAGMGDVFADHGCCRWVSWQSVTDWFGAGSVRSRVRFAALVASATSSPARAAS
jgi:hypothetical protein